MKVQSVLYHDAVYYFTFFKIKNLEDINPFCGPTDMPVLGLLMMSSHGFIVVD